MQTVEVKDTVQVTHPFKCCGSIGSLGIVFVVKKVFTGPFMCPACGELSLEDIAVLAVGEDLHQGAPIYTLTNYGRAAWQL